MKGIELNPANKDKVNKVLNEDTPCLMLCHMLMCPHCVAMHDSWEQVKLTLQKTPGINVIEVEYSNLQLLPQNLQNIRGFPTIQMIENKKIKEEYFGDRSYNSILDFAMKHAKPKKVATKPKTTSSSNNVVKKATKKKKVASK